MFLTRTLLVVALCAVAVLPRAIVQTCDSSPLIVRNANVWTPDGPLPNRDVVFRDGRVLSIEAASAQAQAGLRTIDGTGHTLLPGLVDAHLHFTIPGGLPASGQPRDDVAEITGRQLLRSGVTFGRLHLAGLDEAVKLKSRSALPCQPMPQLQVGGPGLSGAVEKDYPAFQGAATHDVASEKISRFGGAGLDWVAVHDADKLRPDVLKALAAGAGKAGIRVMAAGSTPQEIAAALTLDPASLDYFDRTTEPVYPAATLDLIRARRNLVLVPTPGVPFRTRAYVNNPPLLERAENFEFLSAADRAFVLTTAKKDLAGPEATRAERVLTSLPAKFQQLRQLGLPMAIGSDAGSPLHFQAGAIWWELEAWRALGATPREALTAATVNAARLLRLDDRGRLSVGSRADFVLYRGDVEQGPFELARVLAVGKGGTLFVRDGKWTGSLAQP